MADYGDSQLRLMADRCRDVYIALRQAYERTKQRKPTLTYTPGPAWDGGVDSRGYTRKKIWPIMAEFMLKHKLDPKQVMEIRFARATTKAPLPNQIASEKYLDLYLESTDGKDVQATVEDFNAESNRCREAWLARRDMGTKSDVMIDILFDETLGFSPLFCYCMARAEGLESVADKYYRAALQQYAACPEEYNREYPRWIPEELKKRLKAGA